MTKAEARNNFKNIRKNISDWDKQRISRVICEKIIEVIENEGYEHVLTYSPLAGEVDVSKVFDELSDRVNFYFPRVNGEEMEFYRVDIEEELEKGSFNVMEPKIECPQIVYKDKKYLMLVPGLAFDEEGYRLGYGKGYYDKYLCKNLDKNITTAGICYMECLTRCLPRDSHDMDMDMIIIEG